MTWTIARQALSKKRFPDWQRFIKPSEIHRDAGRPWKMSLTAANEMQLLAEGIPQAHIETVSPCTKCHREHFFSHRAEGPTGGRGMAIAGIRIAADLTLRVEPGITIARHRVTCYTSRACP